MPTKTAKPDYRAAADAVVARYGRDPDFLIPMLQDLQAENEHVPPEAMKRLAEASTCRSAASTPSPRSTPPSR